MESIMVDSIDRVGSEPEDPHVVTKAPMVSGSQTRSNGEGDESLTDAGSVSTDTLINSIDAISLNPNRVTNLSDPSFTSQPLVRRRLESLAESEGFVPWQKFINERIMQNVDYVGEQNGCFILQERHNQFTGPNQRIFAYDVTAWKRIVLGVNIIYLEHGLIVAVACWEYGRSVITGHEHGAVILWSIDSYTVTCRLKGLDQSVTCIKVANNLIIAGSHDGRICVWDVQHSVNPINTFDEHKGAILCLEQRNHLLVSGSTDKEARCWNILTNRCIQVFQGHDRPVRMICLDATFIVTASSDMLLGAKSIINIWRLGTGDFATGIPELQIHGPRYMQHLLLDNDCLIGAGGVGEVLQYNLVDGRGSLLADTLCRIVVALDSKGPVTIIGWGDGSVELMDRRFCRVSEMILLLNDASKIWTLRVIDAFKAVAIYEKYGQLCMTTWLL